MRVFQLAIHKHLQMSTNFQYGRKLSKKDIFNSEEISKTMPLIVMSYHKIQVEPAKSSKAKCKVCKNTILQDTLRVQIVDDRKFNEYIRTHGGRSQFQGEGMYRGYIETERGVISIEKYFVHLACYKPIKPHPFTKEWFRCDKFQDRHKSAFEDYLRSKLEGRTIPRPTQPKSAPKKKQIKKAKFNRPAATAKSRVKDSK